jgi:hypothetical protein
MFEFAEIHCVLTELGNRGTYFVAPGNVVRRVDDLFAAQELEECKRVVKCLFSSAADFRMAIWIRAG